MREKILQSLLAFLQKQGFTTASFASFNSCFDIAARREDLHVLVKVLENIDSFRKENALELQRLASVLNSTALVVGEKSKAFELKDGIIYDRYGLPVVSLETFRQFFKGEIPEVKYFKGMEFVELNPERIKELRTRQGLSVQELAEIIGSSVESVYRYEQGHNAELEIAKRLEKKLGQGIVASPMLFEPLRLEASGFKDESRIEDNALKQLHSMGLKIAVFKHAPFKAFSKPLEPLMINKAGLSQEIERKALVLEKTKTIFDSHSLIIAKEFKLERFQTTPVILEKELEELHKKKEFLKLLKEREP